MSVTENIDRIEQGKTSIISSIKSKGVNVPNGVLINEIAPYINEIQGGGGDIPKTELDQKYEGATVFRINVPTDNYEFAINLCNDASTATYDVDWGDGSLESGLTTDEQHHTYAKAGIYDINIYNLSKDITLGGSYDVNSLKNTTVYYLFNNTNNDSWGFSFNETKDNLTVSDILIGNKITSISNGAFSSCSSLQSVVITESVTKIGDNVFSNCTSLQSVVIPESVTSISSSAFYKCTSLQSIVIPESVTSISSSAFSSCSSLQSVVITESVTKIGDNVFSNCTSLQSVVIPEGVTSISSSAFQGCSSLQSVVIPESVTSLGSSAFSSCTSLQSVVIPESVTSLGNGAFSSCSSLQSVVIPESVTKIGDNVFSNCTSLQSVVITEGVTTIGNDAFRSCTSLQSVVIPEGVTTIGTTAFQGCSSLQSVVIPNSVTSIGMNAFSSCSSLQSVVIPNSVTSIGNYVFSYSDSLQSITVNALTAPTIQSTSFPTGSFKYTKRYLYVPKGATGYDEGNWKTYLIDKGWELRYIEEHVKTPITMKLKTVNNFLHKWDYIGGAKLVDYELVDNEYIYHFDDKIEEIIRYTFYNKVLEKIELPEGVTSIGSSFFSSCTSLQSVVIPNSVTSLGSSAFAYCSSLSSINIPESVTSLGSSAFSNCTSLQGVVIPNSVTSISSYAFAYCSSLSSINIPESVTSLGSSAFDNCTSLQSITVNAMTAPTIQFYAFRDVGKGVPSGTPKILRVPKGATGYDEGNWKTDLINKGYTLEYIEPSEPIEPELPKVAENEDILVIENVDEIEGTVLMRNPNSIAIQYSTNGSEFNEYTTATEIPIGVGEKVYFKWSDVINNSSNSTALVHSSVKYKVYGELKQGNNQYAYKNMFDNESNLTDASQLKLTATKLGLFCYSSMFRFCNSLVQAPAILPATKLESNCYQYMFRNCSSLVQAPELSATAFAVASYSSLFMGCSSLNYVKHNIVNWDTLYASSWLSGVAKSGTVECPIDSTIPSDSESGVPTGWTRVNIE